MILVRQVVLAIGLVMAGLSGAAADSIRVATFNASLNRAEPGALETALRAGNDPQIAKVAEIIQRVRPDILLINEFDYGADLPGLFVTRYLRIGQMGQVPIDYAHHFIAASNTGVATGLDVNGDGKVAGRPGSFDYANDAFGFGLFPGQYGMLILSRYPIALDRVRSFQMFKWADMPGARRPIRPDGTPFHADEVWSMLRLSSKSHWDVPVDLGAVRLHLLASHPTPPVFDGLEDRNGKRNADEIRFWADYLDDAAYIRDDTGATGGLAAGARFVILGDLNADPVDGDGVPGAVAQLLTHPKVNADITPVSTGAMQAALRQGKANLRHLGDPRADTADFRDDAPGNLRVDYVLPAQGLRIVGSGVFWPDPGADGATALDASDHRLVWIDIELP